MPCSIRNNKFISPCRGVLDCPSVRTGQFATRHTFYSTVVADAIRAKSQFCAVYRSASNESTILSTPCSICWTGSRVYLRQAKVRSLFYDETNKVLWWNEPGAGGRGTTNRPRSGSLLSRRKHQPLHVATLLEVRGGGAGGAGERSDGGYRGVEWGVELASGYTAIVCITRIMSSMSWKEAGRSLGYRLLVKTSICSYKFRLGSVWLMIVSFVSRTTVHLHQAWGYPTNSYWNLGKFASFY